MKPLDVLSWFLIFMILMVAFNDAISDFSEMKESNYVEFSQAFDSAVDDVGVYLSLFEAQQRDSGVRYSREKQLSVDLDTLSVFYDNLALKFGIEGDSIAIQNLMLHIPAMAFVRYDGYNLVTLEDTTSSGQKNVIYPVIWPQKPYTYVTDNGFVLYFTLDDNLVLYDPFTDQYVEGTYSDLRYVRDLSPISNDSDFREIRSRTITSRIQEDIEGAMNRHLRLVKDLGINIDLYIPGTLEEKSITDVGFVALIQGYPLPGGETLNSIAFGGGSVDLRETYVGVVRSDGKRIAFEEGCSMPPGTYTILEYLRNDKEAARKGYFVTYCN